MAVDHRVRLGLCKLLRRLSDLGLLRDNPNPPTFQVFNKPRVVNIQPIFGLPGSAMPSNPLERLNAEIKRRTDVVGGSRTIRPSHGW